MPTVDTPWTDQKIEQLKQMLADGVSFSAIGLELKLTRSACIGKAHRLGLRSKPEQRPWLNDPNYVSVKEGQKQEAERRRKERLAKKALLRAEARERSPKALAPAPIPAPISVNPFNLTMDQLSLPEFPIQCRYICNDDISAPLYCGHATHKGSSWCEFHYGRVFESQHTASERREKWLANRPAMKRKRDDALRAA